ncbi:MAG: hypothetical protein K5867_09150 [Bacteroidales bacterium]|nr:hypothetical protein [Bacteroidales bacterium]
MEIFFDIIKALFEKRFESSIPMPQNPNTIGVDPNELASIKKNILEIEETLKESFVAEPKIKESKHKYCLEFFLVPVIIAIALILTAVLNGDICIESSGEMTCGICWCKLISLLIILLFIVVFAVFCYHWKKMVDKNHEKYRDQELKERNDYLKKKTDVFEQQMAMCRHYLHKLEYEEQQQKALLDDYVRDKEHLRKIDMRNMDYDTSLPDKIVEYCKIKNTVTMKDSSDKGKTINIERSILSKDCCDEIKDMAKGFNVSHDDCCEKILKCIFGDPIDCGNVKKILKSLMCENDNDKSISDLIEKIDKLQAHVQAAGTTGLQQVVNIGGENKSFDKEKPQGEK